MIDLQEGAPPQAFHPTAPLAKGQILILTITKPTGDSVNILAYYSGGF